MLKDITIGQYYPGTSPVHRLDPRMKIILTVLYIVMLFAAANPVGLLVGIAFVFFSYALARIPVKMLFKTIKPVLPIILFTAVLNVFFLKDGTPLFSWWIFSVTDKGLIMAGVLSVRIVCLISGTALLTYTTSPITLTDGIERLMKPLEKIKFPAHEIAMMMTIALRFIPTLIEETDKIMNAQKARGADLGSGKFLDKIRSFIPILIPLFVSAFRRADELALAMECRCYHGGEGRTRMRQLRWTANDFVALFICCVCIAGVILINCFVPSFV
ncbi:MAG: energy-coupling factor transporter transmembrane protein EcfT [Ruminococcaceae bacterium]|nr:energy-coupling factor transporter transmembrane protein EcfT [Oscillospiraceae bacterium]